MAPERLGGQGPFSKAFRSFPRSTTYKGFPRVGLLKIYSRFSSCGIDTADLGEILTTTLRSIAEFIILPGRYVNWNIQGLTRARKLASHWYYIFFLDERQTMGQEHKQ
jgi:hypothetical protein